MAHYDEAFVDRFLAPWNRHDFDRALALMTDDCVWEVTRGREPHGADASLAGYGGGIGRKHWLLTHEGAAFGKQAARRTPKAA